VRTALLLLVAVISTACATTRPIHDAQTFRPPRRATLAEVVAAYDAYCGPMRTFSASGHLEVRDLRAGRSRKVKVRVVAARGGRLYLKGTVLVVTALELVSDGSRFWLQVPSKKTVWTGPNAAGPHEAEGEEHAPYYALRPADLSFGLLPEPIADEPDDVLAFEGDPLAFSVTVLRSEGAGRARPRRRVWLDRESLQLERARLYDDSGDTVAEASFSGWSEGLPHEVTITRPLEGYAAVFTLDKAESNVDVPDRAFTARVPEGYTVQQVGEAR
jgi:outer membrane lipoprotein-sorting protein